MVGLSAASRPVPGMTVGAGAGDISMKMKISVAAESGAGEPQAAATPERTKRMVALDADVAVEPVRRAEVGILDDDMPPPAPR